MIGRYLESCRRQLHTIISREIIRQSSPTPSHLQTYNLSKLDQWIPHIYIPLLLLYPNNEINIRLTPDEKARLMKKALSQTLTRYYPFAGRLHTFNTPYVDCNDEGVVFVEANHEDNRLDKFQHMTKEDETVSQLFADGMVWQNAPQSTSLVGVQLNHFACGGTAVAVSMLHRIGDARTLSSFVSHWSLVARYGSLAHEEVQPLNPHYIQSTPSPISLRTNTSVSKPMCANCVTKIFMFPNTRLTDLKNTFLASVEGGSVTNPTRFEVLTSLLYKTVLTARSTSSSLKPSFLLFPVDMRRKIVSNLAQTTVGNFIAPMLVTTKHKSETSLSAMLSEIRKQKMELERVQSLELISQHFKSVKSRLRNEDLESVTKRLFTCSSLCGFQFNKVDFGWGEPAVASVSFRSSDYTGVILMDTLNGDGIEARVTLETQEMENFQNDKEMLSFCKK